METGRKVTVWRAFLSCFAANANKLYIFPQCRYIVFILQRQKSQSNYQEELEDTKGASIIRISKKNRQHNGQKKKVQKDKQRSTKHTYKTKDRVTRTPLKTGVNSGAPEGLTVPAPQIIYREQKQTASF